MTKEPERDFDYLNVKVRHTPRIGDVLQDQGAPSFGVDSGKNLYTPIGDLARAKEWIAALQKAVEQEEAMRRDLPIRVEEELHRQLQKVRNGDYFWEASK